MPFVGRAASVMRVEGIASDGLSRGTAARPWPGLIEAYRDRLPVTERTPNVTLCEGGTPLIPARELSRRTGCEVYLKVEGANPDRIVQGPRHDGRDLEGGRGRRAGRHLRLDRQHVGERGCVCGARRHDLRRPRPAGQDRARQDGAGAGARREAAAGRRQLRRLPRTGAASSPSTTRSRSSTRSTRSASRARRPPRSRSATCSAARRTCTASRSATPATSPRTGRAIASTPNDGVVDATPRMFGFQAAGAAPIVNGAPVLHAGHDRHRDPHRQPGVVDVRRAGARRVARADRRGDRQADPRGLPAGRAQRGGVRRAGVGGQRRRAAA